MRSRLRIQNKYASIIRISETKLLNNKIDRKLIYSIYHIQILRLINSIKCLVGLGPLGLLPSADMWSMDYIQIRKIAAWASQGK
jgi:hypothetical protein